MAMFRYCKCGHIEEDHAMDAPEGKRCCLASNEETGEECDCENFEPENEEE